MAAGACLVCGIWQANKQSHYRAVHQRFTKVHFGWDEMTVERNNKTGRFDCPRCEKSYPEPSGLHKHARSMQSSCSSGPQRLRGGHHNRMNMPGRASYVPIDIPSLDIPESSSSTASRRPSQRCGPRTTRTQRALVRGYWKDEYTVHQIGQYMNLGPRNIWDAINNELNDDLDKDEDYRDGIVGEVINVENMLLDIESDAKMIPKAEELDMDEVDEKIKEEAQSANGRDDQNDPESDIEVLETSPTLNLFALRRRNKNTRQNLQQRVRPADIVSVSTTTILYAEENGLSSNSTSAGPSCQGKSGPLQAGEIVPGASRLSPVRAFLEQLKRPLGQLETVFSDFGITTGQDLDVLCELRDQWELLRSFLGERQGITQLQWMIIRDGMEAHAAQLRQ